MLGPRGFLEGKFKEITENQVSERRLSTCISQFVDLGAQVKKDMNQGSWRLHVPYFLQRPIVRSVIAAA